MLFSQTPTQPSLTLPNPCTPSPLSQHVLGDLVSPPLIGYFSDTTGSLQVALQMTWIAVLVSGRVLYREREGKHSVL